MTIQTAGTYFDHLVKNEKNREFVIVELYREVRELQLYTKRLHKIISSKNNSIKKRNKLLRQNNIVISQQNLYSPN